MAPRGKPRRQKMAGNTRMDAALDAMRQYGFEDKMVRETVEELLDVYEGLQGWPFIEEVSYKLLIETILAKQQSPEEEKDQEARRDGFAETSSAATLTTGITEVGFSSLVPQDPLLHTSDGGDSASQTNDQDTPPPCNQATDAKDSSVWAERGGHGQGIREESQIGLKPTMIGFSEAPKNVPQQVRKPCYGWIDDDEEEEEVELTNLTIPPLPEHLAKLIRQSETPRRDRRRRRKSRWDEKPDDM